MSDKKVTIVITSFNRFDLLTKTIDSILSLNTYPIERFVVIEDSANLDMKNKILDTYKDKIELIFNDVNIGQTKSIDKVYRTVTTEYIFHTEDDYYYIGNPNFIKDSIDILEERKDVHQIWLRNLADFRACGNEDTMTQFENDILHTATDVLYRMLLADKNGWCGFSFMPAVKRTADYHGIFPNGYDACVTPPHYGSRAEGEVNTHAKNNGWRGAILVNGACDSTGHALSTYRTPAQGGTYIEKI